jgi:Fe-S cluster biogenesis protein NfuA/nitrite reductase/ring-hydroxylating ferredoxin subunit
MEFHEAVAELDTLVQTLEREGDERALLLLELVDAIHRPALELIARGETEHPLARTLLAMYDLAPVDDAVLAEEALDSVRPYVESHGGRVELLGVDDGVVTVRMSGACQGCAGSAVTLRRGIEEALREHYPGFRDVVAEEVEEPAAPKLLQIEDLRRPVFEDAGAVGAPGELRAVETDGVKVLLANVGGEVYAFRNGCPVDGLPLEGGRLTAEGVLVCPWHNCAYDARSGKRIDEPGEAGLPVVPVALQDGSVRVAVNVA